MASRSRSNVNPRYTISENVATLDEIIDSFFKQSDRAVSQHHDYRRSLHDDRTGSRGRTVPQITRTSPTEVSAAVPLPIARVGKSFRRTELLDAETGQFGNPDLTAMYRRTALPDIPSSYSAPRHRERNVARPLVEKDVNQLYPDPKRLMPSPSTDQRRTHSSGDRVVELTPVAPLRIRKRKNAKVEIVEPEARPIADPPKRKRNTRFRRLKNYIARQGSRLKDQQQARDIGYRQPDQEISLNDHSGRKFKSPLGFFENLGIAVEDKLYDKFRRPDRVTDNMPDQSIVVRAQQQARRSQMSFDGPSRQESQILKPGQRRVDYIRVLPDEDVRPDGRDGFEWSLADPVHMRHESTPSRRPAYDSPAEISPIQGMRLSGLAGVNQARAYRNRM